MIDRIVIENFKSLRRVDLSLGRVNLFIGANASGKSNFLDALRVLQGIGNGFTINEILDGKPKGASNEAWDGIRGGSSLTRSAGIGENAYLSWLQELRPEEVTDLGIATRDTRLRDAAAGLRSDAARDVERLRSRGWTQADFARALRETLGSGEDGPS